MDPQFKRDVIQWDIENWGKALKYWQPYLEKADGKQAAAFGEREGGLTLWLAKQGFNVFCTDFKEFPEATRKLHVNYGIDGKVTYSQQDITNIKASDSAFDVVVFKSVLGALETKEKQQLAINEIFRVLKPGGLLLFAENQAGTWLHKLARKYFTRWSSYWRYVTRKEIQEMTNQFSNCEFQSEGFLATFGRSENQRKTLSKFDNVVAQGVPKSWKYILIGVCIK